LSGHSKKEVSANCSRRCSNGRLWPSCGWLFLQRRRLPHQQPRSAARRRRCLAAETGRLAGSLRTNQSIESRFSSATGRSPKSVSASVTLKDICKARAVWPTFPTQKVLEEKRSPIRSHQNGWPRIAAMQGTKSAARGVSAVYNACLKKVRRRILRPRPAEIQERTPTSLQFKKNRSREVGVSSWTSIHRKFFSAK